MKTIDDLDVAGRRVLLRADLNVPLSGSHITDDSRIRASLPTLRALLARGARVVLCAHLGRPGGAPDPRYSLDPVTIRLSELLERRVRLAADTVGPAARNTVAALQPGELAVLENLRFNAGETSAGDAERGRFADQLAGLADLYVSDGFGVLHRKHASVYDVALRLPHASGYLVAAEAAALRRLTGAIERPYVIALGGAKVADKLGVAGALLARADQALIGGVIAMPFLAALGHATGSAAPAAGLVATARSYLDQAECTGTSIMVPVDLVAAPRAVADAPRTVVPAAAVPPGWAALDIGPVTARMFAERIAGARTVFWNGPMGMFELAPYAGGTVAVGRAIADSRAFTVVGGGDTTAAVRTLGFEPTAFGHLSTGGGASLEYLAGQTLPGLAVLQDAVPTSAGTVPMPRLSGDDADSGHPGYGLAPRPEIARPGPSRARICIQASSSQAIATSSHQIWFWSKPCRGRLRSPVSGAAPGYAFFWSRRQRRMPPRTAPRIPRPVMTAMLGQSGLVAGAGTMWKKTDVSSSQ
jgi:phosphoglycerate kinase